MKLLVGRKAALEQEIFAKHESRRVVDVQDLNRDDAALALANQSGVTPEKVLRPLLASGVEERIAGSIALGGAGVTAIALYVPAASPIRVYLFWRTAFYGRCLLAVPGWPAAASPVLSRPSEPWKAWKRRRIAKAQRAVTRFS